MNAQEPRGSGDAGSELLKLNINPADFRLESQRCPGSHGFLVSYCFGDTSQDRFMTLRVGNSKQPPHQLCFDFFEMVSVLLTGAHGFSCESQSSWKWFVNIQTVRGTAEAKARVCPEAGLDLGLH